MPASEFTLVLVQDGSKPLGLESPIARSMAERRLRTFCGRDPVRVFVPKGAPLPRDAFETVESDYAALVLDPEAFVGPGWADTPLEALRSDRSVGLVGVMSNETWCAAQRAAPPFPYHTPHLLDLAVTAFKKATSRKLVEVHDLDPFCMFVETGDLRRLAGSAALEDLPAVVRTSGKKLVVARDTYVHRYGDLYGQPRPDLCERVPASAGRVLDVGCARGRLGLALKEKGCSWVAGIERDPDLAEAAERVLDRVVRSDVETLGPDYFSEPLDVVVCGDLIEHLVDPFAALVVMQAWLKPQGLLVLSVPNVGHWSVVLDLMEDRWDYAPFTILSGTHLRFFTRTTICECLEEAGFAVEEVYAITPPVAPVGETFIRSLAAVHASVSEDSLRAVEYVVTARNRGARS